MVGVEKPGVGAVDPDLGVTFASTMRRPRGSLLAVAARFAACRRGHRARASAPSARTRASRCAARVDRRRPTCNVSGVPVDRQAAVEVDARAARHRLNLDRVTARRQGQLDDRPLARRQDELARHRRPRSRDERRSCALRPRHRAPRSASFSPSRAPSSSTVAPGGSVATRTRARPTVRVTASAFAAQRRGQPGAARRPTRRQQPAPRRTEEQRAGDRRAAAASAGRPPPRCAAAGACAGDAATAGVRACARAAHHLSDVGERLGHLRIEAKRSSGSWPAHAPAPGRARAARRPAGSAAPAPG